MEGKQPKTELGKMCQMGIVVWDIYEAAERYYKELGWGPWGIWDFATPDLEDVIYKGVKVESLGLKVALYQAGTTQIELVQPLYGTTIHKDFLETQGEGFHHVKLYYPDVDAALKKFAAMGIYPIQSGRFKEDVHVYLDTEERFGILYEIGNSEDVGGPAEVFPKV